MEELGHFVNFYCGEGLALGLKSRWLVKAPVGFWSTRPLVEILFGVLPFLLGWLSVHSSNKQSNAKKPSLITITHNAVANSRQQQQHTIHKSQAPSANSRAPVATEVYPPFVNWPGSDQWLTNPHVRGTCQFTRSGLGMAWPDTPILLVAICYPVKRRANPQNPKNETKTQNGGKCTRATKRREVHQGYIKKNPHPHDPSRNICLLTGYRPMPWSPTPSRLD